jgi:tetrahydromethanopterin S-methyltransferase subunit F
MPSLSSAKIAGEAVGLLTTMLVIVPVLLFVTPMS